MLTNRPVGPSDQQGAGNAKPRGLPDLKWINRHVPIQQVAVALSLEVHGGMIRCWHGERHQNGDRTPSVGIYKQMNAVKCFGTGCDGVVRSVVDLVLDVMGTDVAGAARWLDENFQVPRIPKGKHVSEKPVRPFLVGMERPIEFLARSGLWARLSPSTQRIAPILLAFSGHSEDRDTRRVTLSYRGIMRYSGVRSQSSVRRAIEELAEIGWVRMESTKREGAIRAVNTYTVTPYSDTLMDLANANAVRIRTEIEQERELRKVMRAARRQALDSIDPGTQMDTEQSADITK